MLLAGAIEMDGGDVALILAMLALCLLFVVCLCLTGGLVARAMGGRPPAFTLGAVAFAIVAGWLQRRFWLSYEVAILAGWSASAAVGIALRPAHPADRRPDGRTHPPDQSDRW
jgi:hypothetical protein